jgi:hypothetical protein
MQRMYSGAPDIIGIFRVSLVAEDGVQGRDPRLGRRVSRVASALECWGLFGRLPCLKVTHFGVPHSLPPRRCR